jgi:hypothetical protein
MAHPPRPDQPTFFEIRIKQNKRLPYSAVGCFDLIDCPSALKPHPLNSTTNEVFLVGVTGVT